MLAKLRVNEYTYTYTLQNIYPLCLSPVEWAGILHPNRWDHHILQEANT